MASASDGSGRDRLDTQHVALLGARAISEKVARRCGLYSETVNRRVRDLGFGEGQARVPCLVIPIHDPAGTIPNHQIRPDNPRRSKDGREVKYETPSKSAPTIYVPPIASRDDLHDLSKTLFVCESPLKAIALAAARAGAVVSMLGIASGRTGSRGRDRGALSAWDDIPLRGREVVLVPDSDVTRNPSVHQAVRQLAGALERRGAVVRFVVLPHREDGKAMGVDDFLASGTANESDADGTGKTREDVFDLIREELPDPPPREPESGDGPAHPYREHEGSTYHLKQTDGGMVVPVLLANFTARIEREVQLDDGVERVSHYETKLVCNGRTTRERVPAARFSGLGWITRADAIITPGQTHRDHLRAAIQHISAEKLEHLVAYSHTGWRKLDGVGWAFLHAGGAIAPKGPVPGVETRLERLPKYHLPDPPEGEALRDAVRASMRLLDVAPLRVTVPLLGAVYRAPIGETTASVFIVGATGLLKTAITALAAQHYGSTMDAQHLPGSWESTENSLEMQAFLAKDVLFPIDDFCPRGSAIDHSRYHARAARIFRATGNHSSRGRMRADRSLDPDRPPRCLVLATGEDVPRGASIRARMFIAEVERGDVKRERLTACQADAASGSYAASMAGYLRWLAGRLDDVRARHAGIVRYFRDAARRDGAHLRSPAIVAELAAGIGWFLQFAVEVGAIEMPKAEKIFEAGWKALNKGARSTARYLDDSDAATRYLDLLLAAITSGEAHLADAKTGDAPPEPEAHGWRKLDDKRRWHTPPASKRIGWRASDREVWLQPDAAYAVVVGMANKQGEAFPTGQTAIGKRLEEAGRLIRVETDPDGSVRYAPKETVAAIGRTRVLVLGPLSSWITRTSGAVPDGPAPALSISWPGFRPEAENGFRGAENISGAPREPGGAPEAAPNGVENPGAQDGVSGAGKIPRNRNPAPPAPEAPVARRGETPESDADAEDIP